MLGSRKLLHTGILGRLGLKAWSTRYFMSLTFGDDNLEQTPIYLQREFRGYAFV